MEKMPVAMISSTSIDLEDYRAEIQDACLRVGLFPKMMEHLSAMDATAVEASMEMVDASDIYVGLFAHRYGTVPEGHDKSITHLEYQRAVKKGIPRLFFFISDEVPVLPKFMDHGENWDKLQEFKGHLKKERVAAFYENKDDLRAKAIQSLQKIKDDLASNQPEEIPEKQPKDYFHYQSVIPAKPEPYIAHPYTLLRTHQLIGRRTELEMLTDWVAEKGIFRDVRIFNMVAIGGMGKSALTWTWFKDIAPQEKNWAGRVWWSFYESDATFENFITRTLSYTSGRPEEALQDMSSRDRQETLLRILDQEEHLLVLDGLEGILIAYARKDAAYLNDDQAIDDKTANRVAGAYGLPESAGKSYFGKHKLRQAADPQIAQFLKKLTGIRKSRILISTRLYPTDIQVPTGQPFPGCFALFLKGLNDQDAMDMWRAYGAKGARDVMIPVFQTFDRHPLLLQVLAYEVAEYRAAPGDFEAWQKHHPDFNILELPLVQVQSEILSQALNGLTEGERKTLEIIAAFRMPATMDTVKALMIRKETSDESKPFKHFHELDHALTTLEDRGLLGWDRQANRYDLHPIVRGVVWQRLTENTRKEIHGSLQSHFEAMPMVEDYLQVNSIEDLTPAIELYHTLIELVAYDMAFKVFHERLNKATLYKLSANTLRIDLLQRLFPEGDQKLPEVSRPAAQSYLLNALAQAYLFTGHPGKSLVYFQQSRELDLKASDFNGFSITACNETNALSLTGHLYEGLTLIGLSEKVSNHLKDDFQIAISLRNTGLLQVSVNQYDQAHEAYDESAKYFREQEQKQAEGYMNYLQTNLYLLQNRLKEAKAHADSAWDLAQVHKLPRDLIRAKTIQGKIAMAEGELEVAQSQLEATLEQVRKVQAVEEELEVLIALSELHQHQNNHPQASAYLEEIWELVERGPYPLFHTYALIILAKIEIAEGNKEKAIDSATEAYRKAWCDGPPYAYHKGLTESQTMLEELGAPLPDLPAFDASKYAPLPEIDWDKMKPKGE